MSHQLVTRTIAALLVPCVLLYAVGCGISKPTATSLKDVDKDDAIIVWTTQGQFHRLVKWEADEQSNITGTGSTYNSLEAANSTETGSPFNGTIQDAEIAAIFVYEGRDAQVSGATIALVVALVALVLLVIIWSSIDLSWGGSGGD